MASFSLSSSLVYLRGSTPTQQPQNPNTIIFNFSPKSTIHSSFLSGSSSSSTLGHPFLSTFEERTQNRSNIWKIHSQLNDVVEKSSNSIPTAQSKLEILSSEGKKDDLQKEPVARKAASDPSTVSAFMDQVSDLVKLVDSRDIVELQLKQLDCEIIIRKKEALPQPSVAAPVMMQSPSQPIYSSQVPQAPAPAPASANPTSAPVLALPPAPVKSKLSHPPLKCPMAGTFYRSPGPGEPPFVKVGDKVQKGQVVCIIEAMKLMNEIESDQSGTVVEVLAEDGKPVSVDTPLFVIAP